MASVDLARLPKRTLMRWAAAATTVCTHARPNRSAESMSGGLYIMSRNHPATIGTADWMMLIGDCPSMLHTLHMCTIWSRDMRRWNRKIGAEM